MLTKFIQGKKDDWEDFLPTCLYAYNTSRHESTGFTPFQLMFARPPFLPIDIDVDKMSAEEVLLHWAEAADMSPAAEEERLKRHHQLVDLAKEKITIAQEKQKHYYDLKHATPSSYSSGMRVLLKDFTRKKRKGGKLDSRWTGPYIVSQNLGKGLFRITEIGGSGVSKRVHGIHLKLYHTPPPSTNQTATSIDFANASTHNISSVHMDPNHSSMLMSAPLDYAQILDEKVAALHSLLASSSDSSVITEQLACSLPKRSMNEGPTMDCDECVVSFDISTPVKRGGFFPPFALEGRDSPSPIKSNPSAMEHSPFKQRSGPPAAQLYMQPFAIDTKQPTPSIIELSSDSESVSFHQSKIWVRSLNLTEIDKSELLRGAWLSDKHINAAQKCLSSQFPGQMGLQDTLLLAQKDRYQSQYSDFIQIVNVERNHWVCVSNVKLTRGRVEVFDSLPSSSIASQSLQRQIAVIMQCQQQYITLSHVDVQRQEGGSDCGLFSIAFAVLLCNRQDPHTIHYDQKPMHKYLAACLSQQTLTPFPTKERPRRLRKKRVLHDQQLPVYCLCRMPWNKKDINKGPMVCCNVCKEWFHQLCMSIDSNVFVENQKTNYICKLCA